MGRDWRLLNPAVWNRERCAVELLRRLGNKVGKATEHRSLSFSGQGDSKKRAGLSWAGDDQLEFIIIDSTEHDQTQCNAVVTALHG